MPHSPYTRTVYPPLQDVDDLRQELNVHRVSWECGDEDKRLVEPLLEVGDDLIEHCDFLEAKLDIKVRIYLISGNLPNVGE